jgi:predicted ATPase
MLQKVRFENYRCLRDVTVSLGPLTVLVGANATGKSTILNGIASGPFAHTDRRAHDSRASISIGFEFDGQRTALHRLDKRETRQGEIPRALLLHLDLARLRAANQLHAQSRLAPNGDNLANVFATLSRKVQAELSEQFCAMVPMFSDVNVKPTSAGYHSFVFEDRWSKAGFASDGTMLVLAYLVAQHQEAEIDLLAIEEPERGLHPYLLGELVRMLRDMSTGKTGRAIQILLATHSAELLDHVQPGEVRFLSRDAKTGNVQVERATEDGPSLQAAYREYDGSLGSLWLSGGLGGVPGS